MKAAELVGYGVLAPAAIGLAVVAAVGAVSLASTAFVIVAAKDSFDAYRRNPAEARRTRRGQAWHYVHRAATYVPRRRGDVARRNV